MSAADDTAPIDPGDIAVIGLSGRFPGARTLDAFWHNLSSGVDSIRQFTDDELLAAGVDAALLADPGLVRAGGVLDDIESFDPAFFGLSPMEAAVLDPQQRVFLECAWESLEHAGYDGAAVPGLVGVFAGAAMSSYLAHAAADATAVQALGDYQILLGNDKDNVPTLVSYKLNLRGPSLAIQTACSTSLVAIAVACQNLLSYQCDMALAGGVRIAVPQAFAHRHQDGGILSPDGRCRPFDAKAQGTVGGNGAGIVVLKRLVDALADGDRIHAVIKSAAINNDGAVKVGYTAPSIEGQAQVIAMAQAAGRIDPRTIRFVEAHGTATELGDPIEVAALTQAFRLGTREREFCALSSVKANVGHLDTAAGVAGFIKAVLALEHRRIPPALHFDAPNPKIDFAQSPFYVNTELLPWEPNGMPRRAGVSSFGIGGTNAHVIVEEAPPLSSQPSHRTAELLVLSARSGPALAAMAERLAAQLEHDPDTNLADVAFTLQAGRRAFRMRRAVVCRDVPDAVRRLRDPNTAPDWSGLAPAAAPRVAFMFAGHGPQHLGMAHALYRHEPTFRAELDRCAEIIAPRLGVDLRAVLYTPELIDGDVDALFSRVPVAHASLFAVEYAMAQLWREWGVHPQAMIGHSLGEYVAACLAGVFSLEDALATVVVRATLIESTPAGAMLAVPLSAADVDALVGDAVSVAAVNGPGLSVASGSLDAIATLERTLAARGLETRRLAHTRAFHSFMLDPVLADLGTHIGSLVLRAPRIPFVSGVTGRWITDGEATDPGYWMRHARETVQFAAGVELLHAEAHTLLEVGPGQTLASLARRTAARHGTADVFASQPGSHDDPDEQAYLLGTLGRLWLAGVDVVWPAVHRHAKRLRTPLPTYPFERRRCWIDAPGDDDGRQQPAAEELESGRRDLADWFFVPGWRRALPVDALPTRPLGGHWLVFADASGVGAALASEVSARGLVVSLVEAGTAYRDHGDRRYTIDPTHGGDYDAVVAAVRARHGEPDTVVHLWSLVTASSAVTGSAPISPLARFAERHAAGFETLMRLMQALGEGSAAASRLLIVATTHALDVTGSEALEPANATVLGLARVIPDEYAGLACRSLDLDPPSDAAPPPVLARRVLAEIGAEVADRLVALRGPHRWVETFDPMHLDADARRPVLREGGVYLLTGGLGGIALAIAEHLARQCRARLVLIGRTALPPPATWDAWIAQHGDTDTTSLRIARLRAIEALGGEVMVEAADVANAERMREILTRVRRTWGAIHGVVHAAGIAGGRLVQFHSPQAASAVIAPKAIGALVLRELLGHEPLDFFLLCSSLTAVHGAAGQADYCAANVFLDCLAHDMARNQAGRVVSVNWDTWREVGMAVTTVLPVDLEAQRAASLAHGFDPGDGVEAAMRVLGSGVPQVAVSTGDLQAAMASLSQRAPAAATESDEIVEPDAAVQPRPAMATAFVAPRSELEREIAEMWQALFSLDQVGAHDNFFELGGHSLLALQVVSRLREAAGVDLSARDLFATPTVSGLAEVIADRQRPALSDDQRLQDALALVEGLSDEDVRALLGSDGER